jgi:subtilisin-like proprotein convertase family protein
MCATTCGDGIRAGMEACDGGPGCTACMVDGMQVVTRAGLALPIPDDHYDGSQGSMTCVDLVVVQYPRDRVAQVLLSVGMKHTYVGDLTFKLISPSGTAVTLMSRPGLAETADDGSNMGGDGSELDPAFPIAFVTGATTTSEAMGQSINGNQAVCKDDATCSFAPSHGAAPAGDLTTFVTETAHGTWRFCAADGATGDTGSIDQVVLTLTLD